MDKPEKKKREKKQTNKKEKREDRKKEEYRLSPYGNCPNCSSSWTGLDIMDFLKSIRILSFLEEKQLQELATKFGWFPGTPIRLSKMVLIEERFLNSPSIFFVRCPYCNLTFNRDTGEPCSTSTA